jgi:hypothetical protein
MFAILPNCVSWRLVMFGARFRLNKIEGGFRQESNGIDRFDVIHGVDQRTVLVFMTWRAKYFQVRQQFPSKTIVIQVMDAQPIFAAAPFALAPNFAKLPTTNSFPKRRIDVETIINEPLKHRRARIVLSLPSLFLALLLGRFRPLFLAPV